MNTFKYLTHIYFRLFCSLKDKVIIVVREIPYWSVCTLETVKIWNINQTHLWVYQDVSICLNKCDSVVFKQFTRASQSSISLNSLCCLTWKRSLQHFPNSWDSEKHSSCEMLHKRKKFNIQIYFANSPGLFPFLENQNIHQNIKHTKIIPVQEKVVYNC